MTRQQTSEAEADQASIAFHLALTKLGIETLDEAVDLWKDLNPTEIAATSARWLSRAVLMVTTRRARSRELAFAYYRLVRALRTGRTIALPTDPRPPATVTLAQLRREFAELVQDTGDVNAVSERGKATQEATGATGTTAIGTLREGDDDEIPVDKLPDLGSLDEALEKQAEQEARDDLESLGPALLASKLRVIKGDKASEVDHARDEARRQVGNRQASAAERIVLNGGRGALWLAHSKDKSALGWARVSRTGTPCGWCAMLISRGAVYRSKASAEYADGDKYHDNCHCYAVPIFSRQQFDGSALFELNRRYAEEWPRVTRGYGGKDALRVWRAHIRRQQASRKSAPAQAA